jgi:hypothetical protein
MFNSTLFFFLKDPVYLQSVTIHAANDGKGEGWHVEEYSVALLLVRGSETGEDSGG